MERESEEACWIGRRQFGWIDGRTDTACIRRWTNQHIYIPFKLYMITQIHLSCLKSFTSQLGLGTGSGSSNRHQQPVLKRDLYSWTEACSFCSWNVSNVRKNKIFTYKKFTKICWNIQIDIYIGCPRGKQQQQQKHSKYILHKAFFPSVYKMFII